MATDTFAARKISKVEIDEMVEDFFKAGDGNLKPGVLYKIAAGDRVATICGANETPDGVVLNREGYQLDGSTKRHMDLAYTINDLNVRVARRHKNQGKRFWGFLKQNVAADLNVHYIGAASGQLDKWAYTDGTEATDCLINVVAKPEEYHAADGSNVKLRKFAFE